MVVSILGFLLSIAVVIYGVYKDYNFIFMSLIGTLIVALTSGMNVYNAFFGAENSFVDGMSGFIADYFILFLLSAIFAMYIDKSGAAETIANSVVSVIGLDRKYLILVAVYIIGAILTMGGISTFVVLFVVIPLARNLFEKMDIPWYLVMTPYFLGIGTWTVTTFPGSPQVQNIIVSEALGTPLTAAPLLSVIGIVAWVGWALWRMSVELNQAEESGDGFDPKYAEDDIAGDEEPLEDDKALPSLWMALLPLIVLLAIIIIGTYTGLNDPLITGMLVAVVLSAIMYHRYIDKHREIVNPGISNAISTTMLPAAAVGFGTVLAESQGLLSVIEFIQGLPIPSIITLSLIAFLTAFAIGTASGALGIVTEGFVPLYDLSGVPNEVVHRLILIPAVNYPPHGNAVLTFYEVSGLDHQSTYRNFNIAAHGGILFVYIIVYIAALLIY